MTTNVIMPVLGMAQDSGKIVRWLKAVGDTIRQGEILMEVETDKAVQELEAPASGILGQILFQEGDVVPVTQVVAVILTPGEAPAAPGASKLSASLPAAIEARPASATLLAPPAVTPAVRAAGIPPERPSGRILASPKARRLAQETQLDLAWLRGSGPDGAILAYDVQSYTAPAVRVPTPAQTAPGGSAAQPSDLHYLARAAQFIAWQAVLQKSSPQEITATDLLVLIAARALAQHPRINAAWQAERTSLLPEINISLAIAVEDRMAWPVIHRANRLNLGEIARERQALTARAQSGKLSLQDSAGGTFSVSYLGMYRVDAYKAALRSPQAAILAVGRITEQVVPHKGAPSVQPVMNLSVSFDPRAISEAQAAKFLETLAELIEEPLMLLA